MNVQEIEEYLSNAYNNFSSRNSGHVKSSLKKLKKVTKDEGVLKHLWCLEELLRAQDNYVSAFYQMKAGEYYEAWQLLERAELSLHFLNRHFTDKDGKFHVAFMDKHIKQYQSLFPYKAFISPEIVEEEKICSICKQRISIRNPCGHKVGEIYGGEMCCRIVTKAKMLAMAVVDKPVQKYSVMFITDPETGQRQEYDYRLVESLVSRLESPFHYWDIEWTKRRHPHSMYKNVNPTDECPCESGRQYKKCCLKKPGVLRPHCKFVLAVPPSDGKRWLEYLY
jgi:hypothetical protein